MKRKIIKIDEQKCNGCGLCIPNCPEGAIQILDGKARLISDLFCDGLGACLGHCPEGAILIEEREAEPYDERRVMLNVIQQGPIVIEAHLKHLQEHGETEYLKEALAVLSEKGLPNPLEAAKTQKHSSACGCPGSKPVQFSRPAVAPNASGAPTETPSALTHWPIQMHLINPAAPQFRQSDLLLAADCVAFSLGNFHAKHLRGKSLAIACPKLDSHQELYAEKLVTLIDSAEINTLTVMIMQVPCCRGLLATALRAAGMAQRKVPIKAITVGISGEILQEEWVKSLI